ncbi:hypothetical protein AA23498_2482 [Acetobacter nitrogenifigens DSM 23921 = NBRC 105050]|uniref:2-amino-thiazoline-4-carboxylic acid hydrolase n=1 Tax=Acetobacter nitrogenifigens DSM 23921 = NBRC 105050 TaxID=1120919 RepID=A0A511X7R9_9PROT|nr:L-2-amino-thiazoline-4-carboxylic acid hydrolase [Acetobacter nitrogenifigens]GBQ95914.1 hypothetical protein AA23498_2482 [Acetobacter nitrogenifigens DSM 23921 = NBRC 105050]GEN58989.1 2-amino-thiazoline-4-carboxylic acid hydrolase [Acetobacter nitrogenifigens DSM 23921 = NBRC 105050]
MTDHATPILTRRRIEAAILKDVYDVLLSTHGAKIALETIRAAVTQSAISQGKAMATGFDHAPDLLDVMEILKLWTQDDALELDLISSSESELSFDVTRCRYAEMYQDMGIGFLGGVMSCQRDGSFCQGINPRITFHRTQTIMEGAKFCDFRFTLNNASNGDQ